LTTYKGCHVEIAKNALERISRFCKGDNEKSEL